MSRASWLLVTLAAVSAAGGGGFYAGRHEPVMALPALSLPAWLASSAKAPPERTQAPAGPVVFYRDPDGPFYASTPRLNASGRGFLPVRASEELSFDDPPVAPHDEAKPAIDPATAGQAARRVRYYRNPMGLPDTSAAPKKDSMGMDYIPVYEGEEEDGSFVKMSPGKLQRTGVRSEPATMRSFATLVRAPGTIQEDERRISVIAVRSEAWIEKVENVTTGDHVEKGQPLLRLYSAPIAAAAADYASTIGPRADAAFAGSLTRGGRQRLQNLAVPEPVIAAIERTREAPVSIVWPAPRDGEVIERNVSDGMRAQPGDVLFKIADHSLVWVLADVAERDLALLAEGQSASVRVRGYPNRIFSGKISLIYPHLMKETRTVRIRVELPNPDGVLRPEMYADVEISTGSDKPVLAVPESAVLDSGNRQVVILDKGDGRFEPRDVQPGRRGGGSVEIRKGLQDGDRIVVSANFLIDAESNLKAALQGLATPGEAK